MIDTFYETGKQNSEKNRKIKRGEREGVRG